MIYQNCGQRQISNTVKQLQSFSFKTIPGEFPWHVAIYRKIDFGTEKYICGGTLINKNTIITAAHCIIVNDAVISADLIHVELGKYEIDLGGKIESKVSRIIKHFNFDYNFFESDIALLKLVTMIEFTSIILPICITNRTDVFTTNLGIVPGWGENESKQLSNELTQITLPILSHRECKMSNENFFTRYLHENNFCAGYRNGTNVCSGDSGSGMIFEIEGKWFLRGIVSLGVGLENETRCDISQNVLFTDVPDFFEWIKQYA